MSDYKVQDPPSDGGESITKVEELTTCAVNAENIRIVALLYRPNRFRSV